MNQTTSQIIVRGTHCPTANGSGPLLQIEVIDSGTGMDPITLSKAFDLFYTSRSKGTGLGLAMVRRIVNKHGGELSIASSPECGTTVCIVLPSLGKMH